MKNKINQTVRKYDLISEGDRVLIALSGGADSVFLAEYLLSVRDEMSLTLEAAHIEHGIRGAESLNDMEFCKQYCETNGIKLHILQIDAVSESKAEGLSVEEYSRKRRYDFFNSIPCDKIATAHNATDNAETLLFRLARGSSLKGLCAIPVKRGKIIRPLIEISGADIRGYLDENGVKYCVDSTNASSEYSRNYIRNELLPLLFNVNSDFISAASRAIELLNYDEEYLEKCAEAEFEKALTADGLSIEQLKKMPYAILGRVIAQYLGSFSLPVDYYRINGIIGLIDKPSAFQINNDYSAISNKAFLRIVNTAENSQAYSVLLKKLSVDEFLNVCKNNGKEFAFCCDYDKIIGSASVRTRQEGDRISPEGRGCTKTIKKLFNELSVPVEKRNSIPVIADDDGVIGIFGYCVDERVKLDSNTRSVLTADIQTEDNK